MSDRPQVCWSPGMRFGEPHIRGRPVAALAGSVWAGDPIGVVAEEYDGCGVSVPVLAAGTAEGYSL